MGTAGESRLVPLFAELLAHLQEVFDHAAHDQEFVITRCRSTAVNLRTQLIRIIERLA